MKNYVHVVNLHQTFKQSIVRCCFIYSIMTLFFFKGESVMSDDTITAEDKETPAEGEGVPPLNLEDDEARPDSTARSTARSTLER